MFRVYVIAVVVFSCLHGSAAGSHPDGHHDHEEISAVPIGYSFIPFDELAFGASARNQGLWLDVAGHPLMLRSRPIDPSVYYSGGDVVWGEMLHGEIIAGWFVFSRVGDCVSGKIWYANAELLLKPTCSPSVEDQYLVRVDASGSFPPARRTEDDKGSQPGAGVTPGPRTGLFDNQSTHGAESGGLIRGPAPANTARILIAITPNAVEDIGLDAGVPQASWESAAESLALTNVGGINLAIDNSDFESVMAVELARVHFTSSIPPLFVDNFRISSYMISPFDHYFEELLPLAEAIGADMASLIWRGQGVASGVGSDAGGTAAATGILRSVIQVPGFISNQTFLHEVGHNLGGGAQHQADPAFPCSQPWCRRGWFFSAFDPVLGTTVEYRTAVTTGSRVQIPYYSNPDVTFLGVATGDAVEADNVRQMEISAPDVSSRQVGNGDMTDTDMSGVPDAVELALDPRLDWNENGTFDYVEVLAGTLTDCDADLRADEGQVFPRTSQPISATEFSPVDLGRPTQMPAETSVTIDRLYDAVSDVDLLIALGDMNVNLAGAEVEVRFDGQLIHTQTANNQAFTILASKWNQFGSTIDVEFIANSLVTYSAARGTVALAIDYRGYDPSYTPCAGTPCSPADFNDANATNPSIPEWGVPDFDISPTDFTAFSTFFGTGDLRADINDAGAGAVGDPGWLVPDGLVTPTDFTAFSFYYGLGWPCVEVGCFAH